MKEFRKTETGLLICEECGRTLNGNSSFCIHINKKHIKKLYYDKWLKEDTDDVCQICAKPTEFFSVTRGYKKYCSKECGKNLHYINLKLSNFKKYGVENVFQSEKIKEKCKLIKTDRYDDKFYNNRKKCRQTYITRYHVEHISQLTEIKEQKKQTCFKNHGVSAGFADIEKRQLTCFNHFGVVNPSQDPDIHKRQQLGGFRVKQFKDNLIYYRGKYELDFLEKYYDQYEIINASFIKYKLNNKNKVYFPDFYIPSLNLIVEIKNSWLAEKDKEILQAKEKATIASGFQYIIIINKKYDEFEMIKTKILMQ